MKRLTPRDRTCFFAILLAALLSSGCATSRTGGVNNAVRNIAAMEKIVNHYDIDHLNQYEGAALLSLRKVGLSGIGLIVWNGTVFIKNKDSDTFGPPFYMKGGGGSVGIIYAGFNFVDCLLLFKKREDALRFAKRTTHFNLSFESALLVWGKKKIKAPGGKGYSDGGGLCLGVLSFEILRGSPRTTLHKQLYGPENLSFDQILLGEVQVPDELTESLSKMNAIMSRERADMGATEN